MSDKGAEIFAGCLVTILVVLLKLWALKWLYVFGVTWISTGNVPTFWTCVWAAFLLAFVFAPASSSKSK